MKNTIKKLRRCENASLLVVSQDNDFVDSMWKCFVNLKKVEIVDSNKKALEACNISTFDIVIVDTKSDNFTKFFTELEKFKATPLKILVIDQSNADNEKDVLDAINSNVYTILVKPFDIINLKLSILMSLNQTKRSDKIKLGKGFCYDSYRDRVYDKNGKVIALTRLEFGLLKLVIENRGQVVDYDAIKKAVWKDKKMSIFTMRNIVSKIRVKTYYDIFKNASSRGYIIN